MKKWTVYLIALAALAIVAQPALAARSQGESKISLAASLDARTASPSLGTRVWYDTTAVGLAGWEHPMIQTDCKQSGVLVWSASMVPSDVVKLGGDASDWVQLGGPAECDAYLLAVGSKRGINLQSGVGFNKFPRRGVEDDFDAKKRGPDSGPLFSFPLG